MIKDWDKVYIEPEFHDQGVDCYKLAGKDFLNEYYIISEAETRKLMNHPPYSYLEYIIFSGKDEAMVKSEIEKLPLSMAALFFE